jgi:hypothetical protein
MTVLDLMSVPGFPYFTYVSEYHQCYFIMLSTIITASLDLTTPYSADSALLGMTLYMSVVLQLTARLFIFGGVLSLQYHGAKKKRHLCATFLRKTIVYFPRREGSCPRTNVKEPQLVNGAFRRGTRCWHGPRHDCVFRGHVSAHAGAAPALQQSQHVP